MLDKKKLIHIFLVDAINKMVEEIMDPKARLVQSSHLEDHPLSEGKLCFINEILHNTFLLEKEMEEFKGRIRLTLQHINENINIMELERQKELLRALKKGVEEFIK